MTTVTDLRGRGRIPEDTLANRLVLMRHELGYSQREASDKSGVPFGTWQGMELGRQTRSLDQHIRKIAAKLGYDREWLMWGEAVDGPLDPDDGTTMSPGTRRYTDTGPRGRRGLGGPSDRWYSERDLSAA